MGEECIHGLDLAACDLCTPKAAPVITAVTTPAERQAIRQRVPGAPAIRISAKSAASTSTKTAAPARRRATPAAKLSADNIGEQRIYHLTHIKNLERILEAGALHADANPALEPRPEVDISSAENREARRAAAVAGSDELTVASYVPFFLAPNADVWDSVVSNETDARLSPEGHGSIPADFVILVSTVKTVLAANSDHSNPTAIAVTDGDAAAPLTRISATREAWELALRKLRFKDESSVMLEAEFLVEGSFDFDHITLVGVANDRVRDVVKPILQASLFRPKVAVYPPWFRKAELSAE